MFNLDFLIAVLVTSVAAFLFTALYFGNPWTDRIYQRSTKTGILKTWKNQGRFYFSHYLFILLQLFLFAWIFSAITIHMATEWLTAGLYFGLFLFLIRILPRFFDTFLMINYPVKLLAIELINGVIVSLIMGLGISYFLY